MLCVCELWKDAVLGNKSNDLEVRYVFGLQNVELVALIVVKGRVTVPSVNTTWGP